MNLVWIAAGGACGAVARYGVYVALAGRAFPVATVVVNLTGAFALGLVMEGVVRRPEIDWLVAVAGIGFLGAFTTFSTFSLETLRLLERGAIGAALLSAAVNVLGSVVAVWAGMAIMRWIDR
jgi:CrcB protein